MLLIVIPYMAPVGMGLLSLLGAQTYSRFRLSTVGSASLVWMILRLSKYVGEWVSEEVVRGLVS